MNDKEALQAAQKASNPFAILFSMHEAQQALLEERLPDETVFLQFMGSGASASVTVGQIRAMLETIYQCKE